MLTYADVHLTYTLPAVGALALLCRPFLGRSEALKMALISAAAVAYTAPWDEYVLRHGAWSYAPGRVLAKVGRVPVEEYAFFVVQTVLTSVWTALCVRWRAPCTRFNHDARTYRLIRWAPVAALAAVAAAGHRLAVPGRRTFYAGCILWWASPVLMFLWYGCGNYVVGGAGPSAAAIAAPTLYLCWVDRAALRARVWHVAEATSLDVFVADHLPLEEALFFLVTNAIVVLAVSAYDKARAMCDAYPAAFPRRFAVTWPFVRQMFRAFVTAECCMPAAVTADFRQCARVLARASKSFTAASHLFQTGIRSDLIILYAFCRVTDDMIDDELNVEKKKRKLEVIKTFIKELFADRKSDYEVKTRPQEIEINWTNYESELTNEEISCFRALSRIAFYLPRKPFYELLLGYQWDVEGRLIRNEDDLLLYSNYVAGSIGVLCVFVIIYKCDDEKYGLNENYDYVIEKAQQMGRVLQLVNIARDIVTDSETLGRCYVPTEYMDDGEEEVRILCREKNPRSLGDKKLKKYSMRIIKLAEKHQQESVNAINYLPYETRGSVLAATEVYRGITSAIQSSSTYPTRASISKSHKMFIGIYSLYIKSIQYMFFK